jgi:Zn-dependent metalloprotease
MKARQWMRYLCLTVVLVLSSGVAMTQPADKSQVIADLQKKFPNLKITINPRTGMPNSVTGFTPEMYPASLTASAVSEPTDEQLRAAAENYFTTSELSEAHAATGNRRAIVRGVHSRKDPDVPGQYVVHVEQRLNDVPVFGSSGKISMDRHANPISVSADSMSTVNIENTQPQITEEQAIDAARARLAGLTNPNRPRVDGSLPLPDFTKAKASTELVIFDPALIATATKVDGPTRLAWLVSIESFKVFVDAKTKEVFYFFRNQPSVLMRRVFDLGLGTNFPGQQVVDDQTHLKIDPLNDDAQFAYTNSGLVREFYFQLFGRDSYNDNGRSTANVDGTLESYVRLAGVKNAYWCTEAGDICPKADVMVFGADYAGAIDVVAHEMTHGVIHYEADLVYSEEAGAVNESLADIFGTLIEFNVKGNAGNWLIGESVPEHTMSNPIRDMSNPHMSDGNGHSLFAIGEQWDGTTNHGQAAHYSELVRPTDPICADTTDADCGCVHFNSGIFNKFAYLISEGGEGVTGIGRLKLARIAYRALTTKLNRSSGLASAANAFVESCSDLARANVAKITTHDCQQVQGAQQAVGLVFTN